jgi:AAA15 family ATPase/GTPase
MEHFFNNIQITNFKSIKQLDLNECSRINLFIGRPNVGKSNILEALGLFSIPHVKFSNDKQLKNFVRVENENELFFDGNIKEHIRVNTNTLTARASYETYTTMQPSQRGGYESVINDWGLHFDLGNKSEHYTTRHLYSVKKYTFAPNVNFKQANAPFLIPPYGINLLNSIEINEKLKAEFNQLFKEYDLKLVFDKASQSLKVMKELKGNNIYLIPYNSVADTLQRIIFYKTAIASNQNSILLFEEPEAHSFPPYITHITQEIINSTTNQFFITTHSPFIVTDFLENSRSELSVFAVNYADGQTVAKKLTTQDLDDIYQNGVDLFTNIETYN